MRQSWAVLVLVIAFALGGNAGGEDFPAEEVADRFRLGRTIYRHDFENLRDPDSGLLLPESASLNAERWPDFWEPIRAVGFPEYLIPTVRVVPDPASPMPGAYRDEPNHVLMLQFDGTRVGIRTRSPVPIDAHLAYEYSLYYRDDGLAGGRIRTGVEWMRIEPGTTEILRTDEIPHLSTGQVDWPVQPARLLVNDLPPGANAARLFVIVDRDPDSMGGAYHAAVWLDNITLKPLPKVRIGAPVGEPGNQVIPVRYTGLIDNIPDPDNPGFYRGQRYTRRVDITDIYNRPIQPGLRERIVIRPDAEGAATEEVPFSHGRFGVYYFNIRLYDADDRLATDVMRAVAVMQPERPAEGVTSRPGRPAYGISAGEIPETVLRSSGRLRRLLAHPGVRLTKVVPWRNTLTPWEDSRDYYTMLAEEIRNLRSGGIGATGVIRPPVATFGPDGLAAAINTDANQLRHLLDEAGRHLGLFMDGWQWGADPDGSLYSQTHPRDMAVLSRTLEEYAGGLPVIYNLRLGAAVGGTFPERPDITEAYFPAQAPAEWLWPYSAGFFPWLFEPYYRERGALYPPQRLAHLAPAPAADQLEEQARFSMRVGSWISLGTQPADPREPNSAAEKVQLEQMLIRAIYASVLRPDVVFLGELFDPARGMLRRDAADADTLATVARPIYLAAATLTRLLEGTEYLGQLGLLPPFEAHVFRRPASDEAVICLWHNDSAEERSLSRLEIATGPPLNLVDWAGNVEPLPAAIPVRRVPAFITGLSASLALTRMSVRIAPEPPVLAMNRRQNQTLEVVNHMSRQAPVMFRLRYAARPDGAMENGWTVQPEELRLNLSPVTPSLAPGRPRYAISPDPNSPIQEASPGGVDKSGAKIAQVAMSVNTSPPADMMLYLPFRLRSDLDVDIEVLPRIDDPHFVTLQLKVRWFPSGAARRRNDIKLIPYYMKRGQMKEASAFPIAVRALSPEDRNRDDVLFETVELRIPRQPQVQTWVGLTEDGGSSFYSADVTDFLVNP